MRTVHTTGDESLDRLTPCWFSSSTELLMAKGVNYSLLSIPKLKPVFQRAQSVTNHLRSSILQDLLALLVFQCSRMSWLPISLFIELWFERQVC